MLRSSRNSRRRLGFAAFGLAMTLSACATQGAAVPAEVDVRSFDVGSYGTEPLIERKPILEDGRLIESSRMSEAAVDPADVDADLQYSAAAAPRASARTASANLAVPVYPVLRELDMLAGFLVAGSDVRTSEQKTTTSRSLTVNLLRFRDEDTARRAADRIDSVDFELSKDNVAVPIPSHGGARAHWRPTVPTLGATMAHGMFVMVIFVQHTSTDLATLVDIAARTITAQVAQLATFVPTPADKLPTLKFDVDGMLARTLPTERDKWPGINFGASKGTDIAEAPTGTHPGTGVVYGPRGAYLVDIARHKNRQVYRDAGVDLAAFVDNGTELFRTRDAEAAKKFADIRFDWLDEVGVELEPRLAVPDTRCFDPKDSDTFICHLTYRRYVALVTSGSADDVKHKAAAQYALLANSQ